MLLHDTQMNYELNYAKENKDQVIVSNKDALMKPCLEEFDRYLAEPVMFETAEGKLREDLIEITGAVHNMDAESTIWRILSTVITSKDITLQGVMGMFFEQLKVDMPYRKGRVLEPFIRAVLASPYVELKQRDTYLHLVCKLNLKANTDNYSYVLPSVTYIPLKKNADAGYATLPFHVITGGKLKQHEGELCLDHINRVNVITYTADTRIPEFTQPEFDSEPKYLDKVGRYENEVEIANRYKQYEKWLEELPQKMELLNAVDNKFYFKHRYDVRGRTYVKAWHLDFIGNKYMRAVLCTAVKEQVNGADKYV